MGYTKIGILREQKVPADRRVAFTPEQALELTKVFPGVRLVVQTSSVRCFEDAAYRQAGITVVDDISDCDLLMGIKEVPPAMLIPRKTYLIFSHTLKKQPHNKKLLQRVLEARVRLIDYEALKDRKGARLVAFGRFAGIVGAYNALLFYGRRCGLYSLQRASQVGNYTLLKEALKHLELPAMRIILTGGGRVGQGAMSILDVAGVTRVTPQDFLDRSFACPVYAQLNSRDYHTRHAGGPFDAGEFHTTPERYQADFLRFARQADVLIAGAYWDPRAPRLFTQEQMCSPRFAIHLIADISCDIHGAIPATVRPTTIDDPVYDYNPRTGLTAPPYSDPSFVTVMAIDNLPCELPRDASAQFGRDLIDRIMPALLGTDPDNIIERGTIAHSGKLTPGFSYLEDFAGHQTEHEPNSDVHL